MRHVIYLIDVDFLRAYAFIRAIAVVAYSYLQRGKNMCNTKECELKVVVSLLQEIRDQLVQLNENTSNVQQHLSLLELDREIEMARMHKHEVPF